MERKLKCEVKNDELLNKIKDVLLNGIKEPMELTGKCKEEFEKWVVTFDFLGVSTPYDAESCLSVFYKLSKSMQFGVYVDFFDSVGTHCEVIYDKIHFGFQIFKTNSRIESESIGGFETRQEARQSAIQKANEIFNNR